MVGLAALLGACSDDPTGIAGTRMEMERARQIWNARDVDDYRMTVRLTGAWFNDSAVITVRDGVPSVQMAGEQGSMAGELWSRYDTVEELFGVVQKAIEDDADHLDATFNARYGLPIEVDIDYSERAADDELGFIVEAFDPQ